jgi:hypothetical protein
MTTFYINLFAGPGAGKSTLASRLFSYFKLKHINTELISEVAKIEVWEDNKIALQCQPYIIGKQLFAQYRLLNKVDLAITDSPLLLGLQYGTFGTTESWAKGVIEQNSLFNNINIVLKRSQSIPYEQKGRIHTKEQAINIDNKIIELLDENNLPYLLVEVDESIDYFNTIITYIEQKINIKYIEDKIR